jgi:hypothetical protein
MHSGRVAPICVDFDLRPTSTVTSRQESSMLHQPLNHRPPLCPSPPIMLRAGLGIAGAGEHRGDRFVAGGEAAKRP